MTYELPGGGYIGRGSPLLPKVYQWLPKPYEGMQYWDVEEAQGWVFVDDEGWIEDER